MEGACVSTHLLDSELGRPATSVPVSLLENGTVLAADRTDGDGRIRQLATGLPSGVYTLRIHLDRPFLRALAVDFAITPEDTHVHLPLLVSGHSVVVYRGS